MSFNAAASAARAVYSVLVRVDLPTAIVRVHDGVGGLAFDGADWLGVGDLGSIGQISSGSGIEAAAVELTLSGIESDYRAELLNTPARGAPVAIYHGFRDDAAGVWSVTPEIIYSGFVDQVELADDDSEDGERTLSMTLSVLSAAAYARRLSVSRRTDAGQQTLFSGDRFFSFKTDLRASVPGAGGAGDATAVGGGGGLESGANLV